MQQLIGIQQAGGTQQPDAAQIAGLSLDSGDGDCIVLLLVFWVVTAEHRPLPKRQTKRVGKGRTILHPRRQLGLIPRETALVIPNARSTTAPDPTERAIGLLVSEGLIEIPSLAGRPSSVARFV